MLPTWSLVWGTADQFQKLEYGERLAADLGTTLTPIEGGKHFTPEDHPEVVAAAINELLPTGHPLPTEEHP
jgi:pimeloyl-ACP methyl ester carboxylesterase